MLGYQGCWIGGVLNGLDELLTLLELPQGVLPFSALTIGTPDENTPYRPRIPRPLVIHTDTYKDGTDEELLEAIQIMNPIADRPSKPGDWVKLINLYFGAGAGMELREPVLIAALKRQGLWEQTRSS